MNVDKIASRAAEIRPVRAVLTVLVLPLYLVGFLIGVVVVLAMWLWAAGAEGFVAGRDAVPIGRDE